MDTQLLSDIAERMVARGKGILAADESNGSCNIRFEALNIPTTEEMRRQWREMLLTAPGIEQYLSGVILFDETIRQKTADGKLFTDVLKEKGIMIGIKVDKGVIDLAGHPGEKITEGLDGLRQRFAEYKEMGAEFAKWRAVITIDTEGELPTEACLRTNAAVLALYALLAQEAGIVPILEPEVLLEGNHTIEESEEVTARAIWVLFKALRRYDVYLPGVILKTSMVVPGNKSGQDMVPADVAERTARILKDNVPETAGGVVFLSGGQTPTQGTENLNEIAKQGPFPWNVTYSYSRAIQSPVLELWHGDAANIDEAQKVYLRRLKESSEASLGTYGA